MVLDDLPIAQDAIAGRGVWTDPALGLHDRDVGSAELGGQEQH